MVLTKFIIKLRVLLISLLVVCDYSTAINFIFENDYKNSLDILDTTIEELNFEKAEKLIKQLQYIANKYYFHSLPVLAGFEARLYSIKLLVEGS